MLSATILLSTFKVKGTNYIFLSVNIKKMQLSHTYPASCLTKSEKRPVICLCLCRGFMAQSTQWGYVECGQFT